MYKYFNLISNTVVEYLIVYNFRYKILNQKLTSKNYQSSLMFEN